MFLHNLEQLMNLHGLNKHSFSKLSGIPYKTIDNFWRKGCENIKLSTLRKISVFFGVTLDSLIFGSGYVENATNSNSFNTTQKEQDVIIAYRNHPEMQPAINKMLDIHDDESIKEAFNQNIADEINKAVKTIKQNV